MPEKNLPSVVFYGTPEFAVPSLNALVTNGFNVKAVVTAVDKPAGRGLQLKASAVKQYAVQAAIPVFQPVSLKDADFQSAIQGISPDLQIIVAFRKLPEQLWKLPPLGTVNLHASLLPDYRGAAPINWAIINGDEETGLTTFLINEDIDAGNILLSERISIGVTENAGELHDKLMSRGADLLVDTAMKLAYGTITPVRQARILEGGRQARTAPKIFREHCRINWNKPVKEIYNLIRGLSPFPASFSALSDEKGNEYIMKIFEAEVVDLQKPEIPGSIFIDGKTHLMVACNNGYLNLKEMQFSGRKVLSVSNLLNGYSIDSRWRFIS